MNSKKKMTSLGLCLLALSAAQSASAGLICEINSDDKSVTTNLVKEKDGQIVIYQIEPKAKRVTVVKNSYRQFKGSNYAPGEWAWATGWPNTEFYFMTREGSVFPSYASPQHAYDYVLQYNPNAIRADGSIDEKELFRDRGLEKDQKVHKEFGKFGPYNARLIIRDVTRPGNPITMGNDVSDQTGQNLDLIIGFNCYQHPDVTVARVEEIITRDLNPTFVRLY